MLWGGGGGRLSVGVYRSELSLDLKESSDSAVTTSWGSPFQSGMVLGKNICIVSSRMGGIYYDNPAAAVETKSGKGAPRLQAQMVLKSYFWGTWF